MAYTLPIEQLSPTQIQALNKFDNGIPLEVRSKNVNELIEILNVLVNGKEVTVSCDLNTFKSLHSYKKRHSSVEASEELSQLVEDYNKAITILKDNYCACYPKHELSIRHQYIDFLKSHGLSLSDSIDIDVSLKSEAIQLPEHYAELQNFVFSYKRTWSRYFEIDPFNNQFYEMQEPQGLRDSIEYWIKKVELIYANMRSGLNEIIEDEKQRILIIKKQLRQHLVNYQHSQSCSELEQMRHKIGFLMADLPQEESEGFSDLVMNAIANWDVATKQYLLRHSRRFNSRNHQSLLFQGAIHNLRDVVQEIEENNLIKVDISNNPLSYDTQLIQVDLLLQQLKHSKNWIHDEIEYIQWRRFYASSTTEEKSLLDILVSIDKSQLANQLKYVEIENWKAKALANGVPTPDNFLMLFDTFKELSSAADWSSVKIMSVPLVGAEYKMAFYEGYYLLSNHSVSDNITLTLTDKSLDDIKPMITLDYYNQSNQANQLSDAIIASKAQLRIYQTRSLNIISCLDDLDTEELNHILDGAKVNELKGESIADLIKGSILDEGKEKLIIIYDDLLNVNKLENVIWQRLVLQSISSAGYKIISINTEDTFRHMGLSKLLSTYVPLKSSTLANPIL